MNRRACCRHGNGGGSGCGACGGVGRDGGGDECGIFINQAYQDLLGRTPSPSDLSTYQTYLTTHTRQRAALSLTHQANFMALWWMIFIRCCCIERSRRRGIRLSGRSPGAARLSRWRRSLREAGSITQTGAAGATAGLSVQVITGSAGADGVAFGFDVVWRAVGVGCDAGGYCDGGSGERRVSDGPGHPVLHGLPAALRQMRRG